MVICVSHRTEGKCQWYLTPIVYCMAICYNVVHISTHWILKNLTNNLITELYWYFMNTQTVNSWYNFLYIRYVLLFIEMRFKDTNQFQCYKASSLYQSVMDRFYSAFNIIYCSESQQFRRQAQIYICIKNRKNTKLAFLFEQSCSIGQCRKNSIGTGEPSCLAHCSSISKR